MLVLLLGVVRMAKQFLKRLLRSLDGCVNEETMEYKSLEGEPTKLLELEKKVYSRLERHSAILQCLEISYAGLEFPYMKSGALRTFLRNDARKSPYIGSQWIETALLAFDYIHYQEILRRRECLEFSRPC
jgi:hypothetical protein